MGGVHPHYRAFDARVPAKADELAAGRHTHEAWKRETLPAQPEVLGSLTGAQLDEVLLAGLATYEAKRADATVYGMAGLEPTATPLGRALALREGWSYQDSMLPRDGIAPADAALTEIPTLARRHFAWYDTSTANDRWMNTPGDDTYWNDGSYVRFRIPYRYFPTL